MCRSVSVIAESPRFSFSQILRLGIGIGLLAIVGAIYLPYAFFTYSSTAVVSARIITLTTPIDGIVARAPPPPGTEVQAGEVIAKFVNTTVDRSTLSELKVEKASLEERITSLEQEKKNLLSIKSELEESKKIYLDSQAERLEYDIQRAKKRYEELLDSVTENSRLLNRKKHLFGKGDVSLSSLDTTFFSAERAIKVAEQAKLDWDRMVKELNVLRKGIFINQDGRAEVVYQDQRNDEIRIRLEEIESRLLESRTRLKAIEERIKIEATRLSGFESREIRASDFSVILRSYVMEGTHVDEKTKVVDVIDCTKVFVDMTIHEGYFEKIKIGERVSIKLRGSPKHLHGTVSHIRGGATFAEPEKNLAGVAPIRKPHEMQVLIQIDQEDLYNSASDFCHVGRTGEVSFKSIRSSA